MVAWLGWAGGRGRARCYCESLGCVCMCLDACARVHVCVRRGGGCKGVVLMLRTPQSPALLALLRFVQLMRRRAKANLKDSDD